MAQTPRLTDLLSGLDLSAVQRAVEEAYQRGLADGKAAVQEAVLKAVSSLAGAADPEMDSLKPSFSGDEDGAVSSQRAPRGLTRTAIFTLLKVRGAMKMSELQTLAVHWDSRISPKTVYNELKREHGTLYREVNEMWSLLGQSPVEAANHSDEQKQEGLQDLL